MNRFSRKLSILAVGFAMGVAVPSYLVRAADEENKVVQKADVPAAVQQAIQARIPAGADVTEYVRRGNGANQTFAAHFKQPGQKGQQKIFVSSSGQFLLGPVPGDEKVTQAQLEQAMATAARPGVAAPAVTPAPVAGSMTPDQARAEITRLQTRENELATDIDRANVEISRQDQQMRDIQAKGGANANAQIDQIRAQQQELGRKRDAAQTELAQNEQRQREVAAAAGIPLPSNPQLANARLPAAGAAANANGLYDRDRDDQAAANPRFSRVTADQVPPAARQALEKYTRDQRDVEYRRDEENGKVFYTAHYVTNDGNRHWLTVAENGTTRIGPKISAYQTGQGTDLARTAAGREPAPIAGAPADAGYRTIPQNDVPKAVVQGATRLAEGQGGHDWQWLRSERGGQTYYSVIYTDKNNRRLEARMDEKGNVIEQPHAAREQPAGGAAVPAAGNTPGHEKPVGNTPRAISQNEVPKAVVQTVTREANNQGGHNWEYFRVGNDDYMVRYTTKDNKQMETRIDNSGKVLEAPHAVK
jgi:hypothetical protein